MGQSRQTRGDFMTAKEALKKYFGYDQFRPGQAEVVQRIQAAQDVLAVMPTGAGKSVCYQIPALLFSGLTLVISPLISLMKDQVDTLQETGIPCAFLNSSLGEAEYRAVMRGAAYGQYKLLYVAPERLEAPSFAQMIQTLPVSMVAVDEAHCVSQWGHDFRPSYTKIAETVEQLPRRPVMAAFTATATEQVRQDIIRLLRLQNPYTIVSDFDRPNLYFATARPQDRAAEMMQVIQRHGGEPGIVYCSTRKTTEKVCQALRSKGISASFYHGGLTPSQRDQAQEDFVYDRIQVMVATNAFGMGIDKPNVRFVLHFNMPKNMESYYQEAGRAGRDGDPAECVLFFSPQDVQTNKLLLENGTERPQASDYRKLEQMEAYCRTDCCLRRYILEYFGQPWEKDSCRNCSNCNSTAEVRDITIEAQKILSCVRRMGERFGSVIVTEVLRGSRSQRVEQMGFQNLSTYGIMKEYSRPEVQDIIAFLVSEGYLASKGNDRPYLTIAPKALPVLRGTEKVTIRRVLAKKRTKVPEGVQNEELYNRLRECRLGLAREAGIPAYFIFSDATLRAIANALPSTPEELIEVPGVGQYKLEQYGEPFLKVLRQFLQLPPKSAPAGQPVQEKKLETPPEPVPAGKTEEGKETKRRRHIDEIRNDKGERIPSAAATYALYQMGKTPDEIAQLRGLSISTVEGHLMSALMEGKPVSCEFATAQQQVQIVAAWQAGYRTFREINEHLPEPVRFSCVQYTLYINHLPLERGKKES